MGTGRSSGPSDGACLACAGWPAILVRARTAVALAPPADALVHALKYGGWRGLAAPMGLRMARHAPPDPSGPVPVVVPVPTTPRRRRRRGYNQARLLAEAYAAALDLPTVEALGRRQERGTQVALDPAARRANVAGAFTPSSPDAVRAVGDRAVILVDDVLTTGATVSAAAVALERAGATGVTVVAFARAVSGGR